MSEKRSWDVQPKRVAQSPLPVRPLRAAASRDAVRPTRKDGSGATAARTSRERLRDRRRRSRKVLRTVLLVVFIALVAGIFYALWLPQMRIREVNASGPGADAAAQMARATMAGTYLHLIPRDSIFFFPKNAIRSAVLAGNPEIDAVSISRSSFHSIRLIASERVKAFIWCGTSIDTGYPSGSCFEADAEGLVFKTDSVSTTTVVLSTGSSTPATAGDLRIFSPLDRDLADGQSPVGAHVTNSGNIPNALRFVKAVRGLGVPVASLALRGDEADLWVNGSTRITYITGHEDLAAQLAASAIPTLHMTDGTIQYLDLRFEGKAYVKRY